MGIRESKQRIGVPCDPDGEFVDGAFDVAFEEAMFTGSGYVNEHFDLRLWYHGTIDYRATASDRSEPAPRAWYDAVDMRYGQRQGSIDRGPDGATAKGTLRAKAVAVPYGQKAGRFDDLPALSAQEEPRPNLNRAVPGLTTPRRHFAGVFAGHAAAP